MILFVALGTCISKAATEISREDTIAGLAMHRLCQQAPCQVAIWEGVLKGRYGTTSCTELEALDATDSKMEVAQRELDQAKKAQAQAEKGNDLVQKQKANQERQRAEADYHQALLDLTEALNALIPDVGQGSKAANQTMDAAKAAMKAVKRVKGGKELHEKDKRKVGFFKEEMAFDESSLAVDRGFLRW